MADSEDAKMNQKKLIKSKSGLKIVLMNQKHQSPFVLPEPPWIPDNEVANCLGCSTKFNFTTRKHHCRRCGNIFCSSCCSRKVWLPRMCFMDPVRVCNGCGLICEKEGDFFEKRLETLQNGATFLLSPLTSATSTCLCLCKLSPTHQYLQFDSVASIPPLPVDSVTNYSISRVNETGGSCLEIRFDNGGLRLTTGPESHRHTGVAWIDALDQAFRLIGLSPSIRWYATHYFKHHQSSSLHLLKLPLNKQIKKLLHISRRSEVKLRRTNEN